MIRNLGIWINDSMSSLEKRIAIQKIVAAVDTVIINNEESCTFDVVFERRLPASTLFNKTPYNKYDHVDIGVFDSVLEKQFFEISNSITIKRVFNRMNTPIFLQQGHREKVSLIAKPSVSYRENRLLQYSDRSFMKKLLSEHSLILEKIYDSIIGYGNNISVFDNGVGHYSDCWEGGSIFFSELGMVNLENSFQIYQMTLALIEFLGSKGFVCSIPKASCSSERISLNFSFFSDVKESQSQLKSW